MKTIFFYEFKCNESKDEKYRLWKCFHQHKFQFVVVSKRSFVEWKRERVNEFNDSKNTLKTFCWVSFHVFIIKTRLDFKGFRFMASLNNKRSALNLNFILFSFDWWNIQANSLFYFISSWKNLGWFFPGQFMVKKAFFVWKEKTSNEWKEIKRFFPRKSDFLFIFYDRKV